jgi:Tfp pilus assembly protein PilF
MAGYLRRAEHHYRQAQLLAPNDPDIALQLGYFYRTCGRPREAELSFEKAVEPASDWPEPAEQLEELYGSGWRNRDKGDGVHPNGTTGAPIRWVKPPSPSPPMASAA